MKAIIVLRFQRLFWSLFLKIAAYKIELLYMYRGRLEYKLQIAVVCELNLEAESFPLCLDVEAGINKNWHSLSTVMLKLLCTMPVSLYS